MGLRYFIILGALLLQITSACLAESLADNAVPNAVKIEVRGGSVWQLPQAWVSIEAVHANRRYILAAGKIGASGSLPVDISWLSGETLSMQVRVQSNSFWIPPEGIPVSLKVLVYQTGNSTPVTLRWDSTGPGAPCQESGDLREPITVDWVSQKDDDVWITFQANKPDVERDWPGTSAVLPIKVSAAQKPGSTGVSDIGMKLAMHSLESWPIVSSDAKVHISGATANPMSTVILMGGMTPDSIQMYKDLFELAPDLCVESHSIFPKWFIMGAKERGWHLAYQDNTVAFSVSNVAAAKDRIVDKTVKDEVTGQERFVPAWDFNNPELWASIRTHIKSVSDAGMDFASSCDFVWPYYMNPQGWGFSRNMKAAYVRDLEGSDEGLTLSPAFAKLIGVPVKSHFWDYFESYHGFRWKPGDVGLKSWSEFDPSKVKVDDWSESHIANLASEKAYAYKLSALCNLTRTYELLRFAQRVGNYTMELSGNRIRLVLNAEHWGNHSDHLWLIGLNAVSDIKNEIFYDASRIPGLYYHGNYYAWIGDWIGKSAGLCYEVQGSSPVFYWGPSYKYFTTLIGYASGPYVSHEDDPFLDWSHIDKLNHTVCWEAGVQARRNTVNSKIRKVSSPVICLGSRSIYMDFPQAEQSWGMSIHGAEMPYFLGGYLMRNNTPYDFCDELLFDEAVKRNRYSVVVYSPAEYQLGFDKKLSNWLNGHPERSVITHSFVPYRPKQGVNFAKYADTTYAVSRAPFAVTFGIGVSGDVSKVKGKAVSARGNKAIAPDSIEWTILNTSIRGSVLAQVGGKPLVCEYRQKGGGRLIYLNFLPVINPGSRKNLDTAFKTHQRLMKWVIQIAGVKSNAPTQDRWWFPMTDSSGMKIWAYQAYSLDDVMYESGGVNASTPIPYVVRPFADPNLTRGQSVLPNGYKSLQTFTKGEANRLFDIGIFGK